MTTGFEPISIDGHVIWVEVDRLPGQADRHVVDKFTNTAASTSAAPVEELTSIDLAATLRKLIAPIHEGLKAVAPEEVSVELMLGIKGEVGFFVAKSEGSASLKITAKWKLAAAKP